MGWLNFLKPGAKKAINFFAGGVIKFAKKPSLKLLPGAAFDVATTLFPVGKLAKVAKFASPFIKITARKTGKILFSTGKAVVPKTIKGKIYGGTAGLIGYGILRDSPTSRTFVTERVKDLPKVPGKIIGVGGDIAGVIEKDKTFSYKDILKTGGKAGAVGVVAVGTAVVIPKIIDKFKNRGETPIIPIAPPSVYNVEPSKQLVSEKPIGIGSEVITPETISVSPTRKRSKRRTTKKKPSMKQSVKINILNAPKVTGISSKKYLKQEIYA